MMILGVPLKILYKKHDQIRMSLSDDPSVEVDRSRKKTSYPLVMTNIAIENGPVEIVSFPMKNGWIFQFATLNYQRVLPVKPNF